MADDSNDGGNLDATHVLASDELQRQLDSAPVDVEPSGAPTQVMFPTAGVDPKADTHVPFPEAGEFDDAGPPTHIEPIPVTDKMAAIPAREDEPSPSGPDTHIQFPSNDDFEPSGPSTRPVEDPGVAARGLIGLDESSALDDDGTLKGFVLEGRFQIDALIGEGGMGRVYRGTQLSVGRPVAIKVLHRSVSQDEAVRQRFMREAKLISSFTHPNTVRLYDFGETEGHLFIAMEYVDGVPLADLLSDGRVSLPFAFEVVDQVCGSLVEAHKADVVHRDVKPANIVLGRSPDDRLQVKLLDFGIAHIDPENDGSKETLEDLTKRGAIVGTPEYMAPEQARGKVVSPATDVYSLGVVLYQLVAGALPIGGGSQLETLFWQVTKQPTPITDHVPNCPSQVQRLVERFLQKNPDDRVASAGEVRSALRKAREQLGIPRPTELPDGPIDEVLRRYAREDVVVKMRAHAPQTKTTTDASPAVSVDPDPNATAEVGTGELYGSNPAPMPEAERSGEQSMAPAARASSPSPSEDERGRRLIVAAGVAFTLVLVLGAVLMFVLAAATSEPESSPDEPTVDEAEGAPSESRTEVPVPDPAAAERPREQVEEPVAPSKLDEPVPTKAPDKKPAGFLRAPDDPAPAKPTPEE